jgi:hypothetical protein
MSMLPWANRPTVAHASTMQRPFLKKNVNSPFVRLEGSASEKHSQSLGKLGFFLPVPCYFIRIGA